MLNGGCLYFTGVPNLLQLQQYLSILTYNRGLPRDPKELRVEEGIWRPPQNRGPSIRYAGVHLFI
jgi:hypothetical protein